MKLSIFPEAQPHPSKEDKRTEAFKFSAPYLPKIVTIVDDETLVKYVCNYAWSPSIFDGVRKADNFVSCDFLVYDIDQGMTIDEADSILCGTNYCYLILPSPSHSEANHRFRIILPLAHSILDQETFDATWQKGAELFKCVDPQCSDSCRAYFGSRDNDGFADFSKDFFIPVKPKKIAPEFTGFSASTTTMLLVSEDIKEVVKYLYGEERDKVPEAVDYFLKNAHTGLEGHWTNSLNRCAFSLALSEVPEDRIYEVLESLCPNGGLDKKDLDQVKRAIRDGQKAL